MRTAERNSLCSEPAFDNSLNEEVFVRVRPVKAGAVATQFDLRKLSRGRFAQTAAFVGGKTNFPLVREQQADGALVRPGAGSPRFYFSDRMLHSTVQ